MANLITTGRLLLLCGVIAMIVGEPVTLAPLSMLLLIVVFAGDGLDGWVARKRNSTSRFGAVFDIAGDRIAETMLWVTFAYLQAIPLWAPLLVIVRGGLVDSLRSLSYAEGKTAFGPDNMMRSAFTRWLTAGRFMRGLYGYVKASAFVFLAGYVGSVRPEADGTWLANLYELGIVHWLGWGVVWLALVLMVIRGLPVIFDALPYLQRDATPTGGAR